MGRCFFNQNLKHYYQPGNYKDGYREGRKEFCAAETKFSKCIGDTTVMLK